MRNIVLFISFVMTSTGLLAMEPEKSKELVPSEAKEEQIVLGNSDFDRLMAKIYAGDGDFDLQLFTLAGTNIPCLQIDDNKFVILHEDMRIDFLNLDLRGVNIVVISDLSVNRDINVACENMIVFGDIESCNGNINITSDNKFLAFGAQIQAGVNLNIVSESDIYLLPIDVLAKNSLISHVRKAIFLGNLNYLGLVMVKMLEAALPNPSQSQIEGTNTTSSESAPAAGAIIKKNSFK